MSEETDKLEKLIKETLKECNHQDASPIFTDKDLNVCEPSKGISNPEPFIIPDITSSLLKSMNIESNDDKINACVNTLTSGISKLNTLLSEQTDLLSKVNEVRQNYWATNIIYTYYKTKSEIYSKYFSDFRPLIENKHKLEAEIRNLSGSNNTTLLNSKKLELKKIEDNISSIRGQEKILNEDKKNQTGLDIRSNPENFIDTYISSLNNTIVQLFNLIEIQKSTFNSTDPTTFASLVLSYNNSDPTFGSLKQYYNEERRTPSEDERKDLQFFDKRTSRLNSIMNDLVIPSYNNVLDHVANLGKEIALSVIVYNKNYETNANSQILLKDSFINDSNLYEKSKKISEDAFIKLNNDLKTNQNNIDLIISQIKSIECFKGGSEVEPTIEAGSNFGLGLSDPKQPTITTLTYWKKFCEQATLIGVVPTYWATGLLIPNPSGILPIPFPIVFKPIAVIPTPIGIFVFIIGQRGMLPCPILYYLGPGIESTFIAAIRASNLKIFSTPGSPPTTKLASGVDTLLFDPSNPISDKISSAKGPGFDTPNFPKNISLNPITTAAQKMLSPVLGKKFKGGDLQKIFNSIPVFYSQDDLPPWERLNAIKNIAWTKYLNNWCLQAKVNSGYPGFP